MSGRNFDAHWSVSDFRLNCCDRAAMNIPAEELTRLMIGVADAFHVAAQGRASAGYRALCEGLFQTREVDASWGPEVTQLWSLALAHFIKRHPATWFATEV